MRSANFEKALRVHSPRAAEEASVVDSPCLYDKFLIHTENAPGAVAVICGEEQLTYQQLADWSAQIAQRLVTAGVRPEELVALDGTRSIATIAGMLGILRAQAAYLPIDPELPDGRVKFLLNDAQVNCAVISPGSRLTGMVASTISTACAEGLHAVDGLAPAASRQLAYVIYTSGSTGEPKGVMIEHRSATATIDDVLDRFHFNASDRVLALSSFGFDLSVFDIFGTLAAGGCIVLPTPDEARNPRLLFQLIQRRRVTVWNSVPALLELLLNAVNGAAFLKDRHLRLVMLSGDWISLKLPQRLKERCPRAQLVSLGGATEAAIWSCFYTVEQVSPDWKSIPYGWPLSNQHFHILDDRGRPCRAGVAGELYIGGSGVARGYLNRPELTANRFPHGSFDESNAARLYRTGDLGRYLPDGAIEFLGRMDLQVKINGYRIELGEIEAQLMKHPRIREAVVVARRVGEQTRLIAHVVMNRTAEHSGAEQELSITELRTFLVDSLPKYMLPSAVVHVEQFALNSNGKVDRSRLSDPPPVSVIPVQSSLATELEQHVAAVFATALRLPRVDVDANFLELDADSLAATTLMFRLEDSFGINLAGAGLPWDRLSPRAVAKMILDEESTPASSFIVQLQPFGKSPPLFCFPGVDGHLLKFRHLAEQLAPDQPVYGLLPPGAEGGQPLETIAEIADCYAQRIRTLQPTGPYRLLGFSLGGVFAFETARRLQQQGASVESLILLDSSTVGWPDASLLQRVSFHIRYALSLPRAELSPFLRERARVAWIRLCGSLRRAPRVQRDIDVFQLTPSYARVALANLRAASCYVPQPYEGHGVLFRAAMRVKQSPVTDAADEMGWTGMFRDGLTVVELPGAHADLLRERNVVHLVQSIRNLLFGGER